LKNKPLKIENTYFSKSKKSPTTKKAKKLLWLAYTALTFATLFMGIQLYVILFSLRFIENSTDNLPHNKVGLVLGTSKYLQGRTPNPFFANRMQAAADLYFSGKIDKIIVSGDNRTRYYNEPQTMKNELVKLGVPASDIIQDAAGLRTLDSVVRCYKVFGQSEFTVISQQFHNIRAIYIARYYGLSVVAYNAGSVSLANGSKTYFREIFARTKMLIDLHITNQAPTHLGKAIDIE